MCVILCSISFVVFGLNGLLIKLNTFLVGINVLLAIKDKRYAFSEFIKTKYAYTVSN